MILREIRELVRYHSRFEKRFSEHDCNNAFKKAMLDLKQVGLEDISGKRVLDLGCGQRFPFALQCAAKDAKVTALDLDYIKPDFLPLAFFRAIIHNGLKRATKSLIRKLLFDPGYYRNLDFHSGKRLRSYQSKINFIVADPEKSAYPLPSDSFDLIASNAVVEHVEEIQLFSAEIKRLLVQGGYFYAIIHNYYSVSGGHNLEWAFPDQYPSEQIQPWDHLRDNLYPSWVYLNKLKPEDYLHAFDRELEILCFEGRDVNHDPGGWEGEVLLTPEIERQLSSYSKDLLLTRAWCLICRKN